jgi:hypothetical protein
MNSDNTLQKKPFINSWIYWIITLIQITFNVSIYTYLLKDTNEPVLQACLIGELVVFPILCLIIALIAALITNKKHGFKSKYKRAFLISYLTLNSIFAIFLLAILIKEMF